MRASMPLMSGNCKSISVISGRCCLNCLVASRPVDASATTFISDSALTKPTMPFRNNAWSSTVSTRIGPELTMTHHSSRTGEIDAEHEVWHTRFGLAPLVPPPYPRRLRSRMSSVHRSPLHAPGFPGAPNGLEQYLPAALFYPCPFRHLGCVDGTAGRYNGSRPRFGLRSRAEKRSATTHAQSCTPRPGEWRTKLAAAPPHSLGRSDGYHLVSVNSPSLVPRFLAGVLNRFGELRGANAESHPGPLRSPFWQCA